MKIEIKKIGNSDGLLLPRELMQRLDLKRGQELHITELAGGGFQAMPYDPDFEKTMEIADETMDKYRDTLAKLGAPTLVEAKRPPRFRGGFVNRVFNLKFGDRKMTLITYAEPGEHGRWEQFMITP